MNSPADTDWRHLLTEADRARMLDDVARVSLAVGRRLSPERQWEDLDIAAHSLANRKSPVERLWFMERLLPGLTQAVYRIQESPLTRLTGEARAIAPPARARRVERAAILAAVRRGHAGRRLDERVAAWRPDTQENRAVKAFLAVLSRDAEAIGAIAGAAGEAPVAEAAGAAARRLHSLRALPLWAGVADDARAWRLPPTHRMLADAHYARLSEAMRRYRQSFQFDWAHPLFALPARESWRLYEVWGLFQVLEALMALGYAPTVETDAASSALFPVHQDRLTFAVVRGTESRVGLTGPDGRALSLFYSRAYPQRTRSRSRTMMPDIVVERLEGAAWVLDTKFKAYQWPGSEGDDMDQMHAYRDAIVDPGGRNVVARAWCLFCGGVDHAPRPLIAYAPPAASIVGALHLRPGAPEGFQRLRVLLSNWFA